MENHRSGCPVNLMLEVFGDKWSLIIIRDIMFQGKRYFRELLQSEEGIASNILSDRLAMVEIGGWSIKHKPVDLKKHKHAKDLVKSGKEGLIELRKQLVNEHLK